MSGEVKFSDITHLRYWSGAGHNKEVHDRLGLISPPLRTTKAGKAHDHTYKNVDEKNMSHLSYHSYRSGKTVIAADKKTKLYSDVTCKSHPVAGDLATGADPEMINLQDIFKETHSPIIKVLSYFHERALNINPAMASDIARVAFIIKLRKEGKSSAYTDWDAGQDLYDLTRGKNLARFLHYSWDNNTGHQEESALMRVATNNAYEVGTSNDVMLSLMNGKVYDEQFMVSVDQIIKKLTLYFIARDTDGDGGRPEVKKVDRDIRDFLHGKITSPDFDHKLFEFMKSELKHQYDDPDMKGIMGLFWKKILGYAPKKPHSFSQSLIEDAHVQYEKSMRVPPKDMSAQDKENIKTFRSYVMDIAGPDALGYAFSYSLPRIYTPEKALFGPRAGVRHQNNDASWLR